MSKLKLINFVGLFFLAAVLALTHSTSSQAASQSSANAGKAAKTSPNADTSKRKITNEEKVFFGAAGAYLKTANDQGSRVARAMAGASTGKSTLGDIEAAVKRAVTVENAGYFGDYQMKVGKKIPALFAENAKDIDEAHRLFQAAMKEYLRFFSDHDTARITSAEAVFMNSAKLQNKSIAEISKKAARLSP